MDKNRVYSVVVVYRPDGRPHSWCIAETSGQAKDIERVYRQFYKGRDGYTVQTCPAASHAKAMHWTPPPLPGRNTPAPCRGLIADASCPCMANHTAPAAARAAEGRKHDARTTPKEKPNAR